MSAERESVSGITMKREAEKGFGWKEKQLSERHGAVAGVHRDHRPFWVISLTHTTIRYAPQRKT